MAGTETYLELARALRGRAELPELAGQRESMLNLANHLEKLALASGNRTAGPSIPVPKGKLAPAPASRGLRSWFRTQAA